MAATNCLNFGSPEKPEVMWQFSEAIDGLAEACTALGTPITGGNVSFVSNRGWKILLLLLRLRLLLWHLLGLLDQRPISESPGQT